MQEKHPGLRQCFAQVGERGNQRKMIVRDSAELGPMTLVIDFDEHPVLSEGYAHGHLARFIVRSAHSDDSRYIGP